MAGEKNFEERIKAWFHTVGIYPAGMGTQDMKVKQVGWYSKIWGGGFQKAGIPDILCCINGLFVAVEVKDTRGRATTLQKINCNRIRDSGGQACILYPSGFERFRKDIEFIVRTDRLRTLKDIQMLETYK